MATSATASVPRLSITAVVDCPAPAMASQSPLAPRATSVKAAPANSSATKE